VPAASEVLLPCEVGGDGTCVSATGGSHGAREMVPGSDKIGYLRGGPSQEHAPSRTLVGVECVDVERDDHTVPPMVWVPAR
jgi:hypothetical protein